VEDAVLGSVSVAVVSVSLGGIAACGGCGGARGGRHGGWYGGLYGVGLSMKAVT
jgi:hypothetical protein